MASFTWPPFAAPLQAGGVQSYVQGSTFTGLVAGGSATIQLGVVPILTGGGLIVDGVSDAQRFNFFLTYRYFPDGGLRVGGVAVVPSKFSPDPNFPYETIGPWTDDVNFPGEAIGGN